MKITALPAVLFSVLFLAGVSTATTYTTTADGCGAKNLGYCRLNVIDQASNPFAIVLDTRYTSTVGQLNTLSVYDTANTYPPLLSVHGAYSGFFGNPNGTHNPYYGAGAFLSDDGTVQGTFLFYAYYVKFCSGRGCGGGVVGWHFRVLVGSTVINQ